MRAWILVVLLIVAAPALADTSRRSPFSGDARLEKKVSVRWKKATLYDALKELSRATGVTLTPDRALVDEPLMGSATEVPARELLDQLAELFHFTWVRSGGKPEAPNYLIFQDRAAKQEEENEINAAQRAVLQALEQQLERHRRISRMPPEQLQRELDRANRELETAFAGGLSAAGGNPENAKRLMENMTLFAAATPVGRVMLGVLDGLTPGHWQQLMNEQPIVLSSRPGEGELPLPPAFQDALRGAAPQLPFPKSLFRSLGPQVERSIGQVEQMMQEPWSRADGYSVTVRLSLNTGGQPLGILSVSPSPLGETRVPGQLFAASGLTISAAPSMVAPMEEDPMERARRLAADPVLGKKAELKLPPQQPRTGFLAALGNTYRVAEILPEVEAAYGVRIVGDAYNRLAMSGINPPKGEQPLYRILDEMAGSTRRWERDGDLIRFRSRTWAFDRRAEVPMRYMRRWLAVREKQGGFTLDDVAEIAGLLRDEQVDSLMFAAMECDAADITDFVLVATNRDPLRLYARLLPAQRRHLLAGGTIPVRALYPYQQAALLGLGRTRGQSMFTVVLGGKPPRRPEVLASGVLSLEVMEPDPPKAPAQPANRPAGMVPSRTRVHRLRLTFPDGQKDEFAIPLSRLQTSGGASPVAPSGR